MWELRGVEISAFPLTWHTAYTTACCYRTSRDKHNRMDKLTVLSLIHRRHRLAE